MRNSFGLIFLACILVGCSAPQKVTLKPGAGQDAIVRDGFQTLVSNKKHLVMLRPNVRRIKANSRVAFTVLVRNLGSRPENLTESSVTATYLDAASKPKKLKVFTHDELEQEELNRQTAQAIATAIGGFGNAMSAANAGYSNTSGTVRTYTPNRGTSYGTFEARSYDAGVAYAAQAHAQAQTAADFAQLRAEGERNLANLESAILKDQTVMPGEWYGGSVVLQAVPQDGNAGANYVIAVSFGGDTHAFEIQQSSSK